MPETKNQAVLFDWGDTVMRNFPEFDGPMQTWPKVGALPGIRAAIEDLTTSSIVALATNAEDSDEKDIRTALDRCGLDDLFDCVFCFRRVGRRKPEPEFFEAVLRGIDLDAANVFMVGDSLDDDVHAANAVGIPAVWFNPSSKNESTGTGHRTIHRHEDLPGALRELGAKIP